MSKRQQLKTLTESYGFEPQVLTKDYVIFADDFYCHIYPLEGKTLSYRTAFKACLLVEYHGEVHGSYPYPMEDLEEVGSREEEGYRFFAFTDRLSESAYGDLLLDGLTI